MAYKAGDLREHIELHYPTTTQDEHGYESTVYVKSCTMAAAVASVASKDYFEALAAGALDTVSFTVRWNSEIETSWRVKWNGVYYSIKQINVLGARRDYMTLKCSRC